jgi:TRAP-type C4-dicarboxylate transport system permease small subunit
VTASQRLGALDARVYRVEKSIVGTLFVAMAVVVFLDVVHRIFSRVPGRLSVIIGGMFGVAPESLDDTVSPAITLVTVYLVAYGALRTRALEKPGATFARGRGMLIALGITAVLTGIVQAYVRWMPDGVVWAPYLGLSMLLWVGLLGGSMATHAGRHLALEMGEKLWPAGWRPLVRRLAQAVTAGFCGLITVLAAMSLADHYDAWTTAPNADLVPSVDIPKWIVFLVVPYAFGMMGWRFFGRALGLLEEPPPAEIA